MSAGITTDVVDVELLDLAAGVLVDAGYSVTRTTEHGIDLLLAEDADNVVAITAVTSTDAIFDAEPAVTRALASRFAGPGEAPKRWDAYAVLLTSSTPDDAKAEALFSLSYNLKQVRRIVRVGVDATV